MDLGPCTVGDAPGKAEAPHTGTTIVAVSFDGGVVLGADGRVSTGTYISNRASNKIQQLTDNVFLLRSGSAADTQAIGDYGERQRAGGASGTVRCARSGCAPSAALAGCRPRPLLALHDARRSLHISRAAPGMDCALAPRLVCRCDAPHITKPALVLPSSPLTLTPRALHALHPLPHPAVRYFSDQLAAELGKGPSVATVAKLVATVRGLVWQPCAAQCGGFSCAVAQRALPVRQAGLACGRSRHPAV